MKKNILFILLLLISGTIMAEESGIRFFHGTWEEALSKAKEEKKLIFIDFYTKWCGPCKMMAEEIFTTRAVGDFYNSNFINYKVDAETEEGRPLAKKYKVSLYPTYSFIDPNTMAEVHKSTSRQSEEIFIFTGKSAISKDCNSGYLENLAKEGSNNADFLYNYAFYKASKGENEIAEKYISQYIKDKGYNLSNPLVWNYFTHFVSNRTNPLAIEFISNKEIYTKIYGDVTVNNLLFNLYRSARSEEELKSVVDFPGKEYLIKKCRLEKALTEKKYQTAKVLANEIMADPCGRNADFCNDINYIIRMPMGKDGDKPMIEKELLEIYISLYRYAAYNVPNRDNGIAHFNYASLLEYLIINKCPETNRINTAPDFGAKEYSMRPLDLAKKPTKQL